MDYCALISQVIDDLEDDFIIPESLSKLSQRYSISRFHFSRIFQAVTHRTLKAYVDERRLNAAAQQLRQSRRKVIDIAFDSGFQSHEGFSRRFQQVFGLSPTQYRRSAAPPPLLPKAQIVARNLKQIGSAIAAEYRLIDLPEMRLWGQSCLFNPDDAAAFPQLTHSAQAFVAQHITPNNIQRMLSVISRVEGAEESLCCFTGYEGGPGDPGEDLTEFCIAAGRYAVFRYRGDMCAIFETVFSDICLTLMAAERNLRKSDLEFFNIYEGNYFQDGWFAIYVPIQ